MKPEWNPQTPACHRVDHMNRVCDDLVEDLRDFGDTDSIVSRLDYRGLSDESVEYYEEGVRLYCEAMDKADELAEALYQLLEFYKS